MTAEPAARPETANETADEQPAECEVPPLGVRIAWVLLALPALGQLALLLYTVVARVGYPYDLEWMEGGMLGHAHRIAERQGIYVEPSVEFIPYLYTPLYPALLALLGGVFGIGYTLGRVISILAMLAIVGMLLVAVARQPGAERRSAWCGGLAAVGLFAATYPWLEGWYDVVRADTLFVAMAIGGLLAVRSWAGMPGVAGQRRIAVAALVLGLSYLCKQTGVFYVAIGGAALLVLDWRRVPIYVAVTGLIGLGGTWLLDRASGGWFWTYVFEMHQAHDWNVDRFWASFGHILGHFPFLTAVVVGGLAAVATTWLVQRQRPPGAGALLFWSPIFAISVVVGAVSWGTQWAHFNAFMPAMTTGALAAGAAIPAVVGSATCWRWPPWSSCAVGLGFAAALAAQLVMAWWQPARFIPTAADRAAGQALVERLREIDGEILMPYHPWYPVLAGKPLMVHRMGIMDVTYGNRWKVAGLREAFEEQRFAAVVLDNRPVGAELPGLARTYRLDDVLPREQAPRVYTGASVVPRSIWVPARPATLPEGATVLFDFESGKLDGWRARGRAWGNHPASGPVGNQGPVRRYGGRYFVTSYHGGDKATGTLTSPEFELSGASLTFRLSGGNDEATLRAELWVDGQREKVATGNDSEGMVEVMWNVAAHAGKTGRIVLVDEATGAWGHLNADEFWLRQ